MAQVRNWTRISSYLEPVDRGRPLTGVSVMLEELAQIIGDAAFVERADLAARARLAQLEDMMAACEQEMDGQEGEVAQELDGAIADLRAELAQRRDLQALDAAFREDQRDAICARLERFRQNVQAAIRKGFPADATGAVLDRADMDALLCAMSACDAGQIFRAARMQATGCSDVPEGHPLLSPEGWQAWLAERMAERAGAALRQ